MLSAVLPYQLAKDAEEQGKSLSIKQGKCTKILITTTW